MNDMMSDSLRLTGRQGLVTALSSPIVLKGESLK